MSPLLGMGYVQETLLDNCLHMIIVQGIVDQFSVSAVPHQAGIAQQAQVVRDIGSSAPQDLGNIGDAQLLLSEDVDDFQPGLIGQHLEKVTQPVNFRQSFFEPAHGLGIEATWMISQNATPKQLNICSYVNNKWILR